MKRLVRIEDVFEYIYSHATAKSDVGAKLSEQSEVVVEHLIKLYLYPTVGATTHWRREIFSSLHSCPLLKNNKKLPDSKFIYDRTCNAQLHYIEKYAQVIADEYDGEYGEPERSINVELLSEIISLYFEWLSDVLSKNRYVSSTEVYNMLDKLGLNERSLLK